MVQRRTSVFDRQTFPVADSSGGNPDNRVPS